MTLTLLALLACGGDKITDGDDLYGDTDTTLRDGDDTAGDDTGDTGGDTGGGDTAPVDGDGDGYAGAADCDDSDASINPGATEICDDADNDCDYDIDEGVTLTSWEDRDLDGFGDPDAPSEDCAQPDGYVDNDGDCDDDESTVNPDAEEICGDGLDNNCDGVPATDCGLLETIALEDADVILRGSDDGDYAGHNLDAAGDVDGDGNDDLLVGAFRRDDGAGAAYLFYGPLTTDLTMDDADASIPGPGLNQSLGYRVLGAGDTDGDGLDDLLVTIPGFVGVDAPEVLLLRGPLLGTIDPDDADARIVATSPSDYTGYALGSGDINGDGVRDVLLGGSGVGSNAGAVYVLHGPVSGALPVDTAAAVITGANSGDNLGYNGVTAVDLDGDGADDLVAGAPSAEEAKIDGGAAYVFFGSPTGALSTSDAGVTITAQTHDDQLGWLVRPAGDVNGDGAPDLLVTASANDSGGTNTGTAYLFHGPMKPGALTADDADATLIGVGEEDLLGDHATGAGDFNNDSYDDLLVSALGNDDAAEEAGSAWLVYGPAEGAIDLATDASVSFPGGATADYAGSLPTGSADINNDGFDDVIVGARQADSDGMSNNGAVYIIFGVPADF